ncbi:hypothetical protein HBE96_03915 [Clostridium sp. P21]|uniref:Flagellin C-terminal domain-containing protein n=2 Tax=Clostridium muellerianum TaxID=2716538 RepID=A0A7Y0HNB9_9CLOT|nr:hypothetical protein [Clostridium muellerianum]
MSKVSSPQANDAWEVAVTAAKSASTTTSTTTVATAAKASAVKIGDNSFTIDAGKGNGADGNIAIEIKQSANAGEDSTAVFSNDGKTLTLTLDKGKTFTSDDIQKLISSANKDDNKPTYLDMTKFTVKADDAANDSIDASKLSGTTTTSLSGGASLPTFTSSKKAEVTNGTDDVVVEAGLDVSDHDHATHAISVLDKALAMVSTERGKLGAMQNRLEHTINNLNTSSENLSAAESRIRDTDMANEMMTYSKSNILSQASQAMIAQAKSQPEQVLQLLR